MSELNETQIVISNTERLLQRAAEIDPEAWKSPMPERMGARRSRSFDKAFDELSRAKGAA